MSASKILADFYISIIILKFWTTFGSAFSIPYKFYFMDMIALHISLSVVFIIFWFFYSQYCCSCFFIVICAYFGYCFLWWKFYKNIWWWVFWFHKDIINFLVKTLCCIYVCVQGYIWILLGVRKWLSLWRIHLQWRRPGFDPWVGKFPLEKGKATQSNILTWSIPWTI